jgi:hypothetical protein
VPFELSGIVPWGRSFDEYRSMFGLTSTDVQGRLLGCGDGPASFNADATREGIRVVSVDPIYSCTPAQIRQRIEATTPVVAEQVRRNPGEFVWTHFSDAEDLVNARLRAMTAFLGDIEHPGSRYVAGALPNLPLKSGVFDLALCSHLLFLYSATLDLEFHLHSIRDLLRVAREVRIFPLLELGSVESRHLTAVSAALVATGVRVERRRVDYEVQRGGNQMVVLTR